MLATHLAYFPFYSTETSLIKVTADILLVVSGSWFIWEDDEDCALEMETNQQHVTSQGVFLHSIQGQSNRRLSFPLQQTPRLHHFNSFSINIDAVGIDDGKENSANEDCEPTVPSARAGITSGVEPLSEEPFDNDWEKVTYFEVKNEEMKIA